MTDELAARTRPVHAMRPEGWRNRYWAGGVTPKFFAASEVIVGGTLWPTKEIAEEKGAAFVAKCLADKPKYARIEYLGAHPEYGPDKTMQEKD